MLLNSLKRRMFFIFSAASLSLIILVSFQNCGPQLTSNCPTSTDSIPSSGGNADSNSNTLTDCSSTSSASTDATAASASSPFQGSSSTGGSSNGNYTTTRSTYSGSRNGSSGSSGQTDGYGLTRTCNSTGCPGTTFMFQYVPQSITVDEGTPATIRGVAVNAKGTITYQWYKNNAPITVATNSSATSGTLMFYPASLTDNGAYYLEATDAGNNNKVIKTLTVIVKVNEVKIDCALATYGWNSVPVSRYVVGVPASYDQWNPPGHRYFLAASTSLPNGSPIGFDSSGGVDLGTVLFNPPEKILEGNFTSATCQGIRSGSVKAANALGIPACSGSILFGGQTLVGEVSLKCIDGKLEIITVGCSCDIACSAGYTNVGGQCYQECVFNDGTGATFPGYWSGDGESGSCVKK